MNIVINNKQDIYNKLALFINQLLLDENIITLVLYQKVQDEILKKISK